MLFSTSYRQIKHRRSAYEVKFPISQINSALIFLEENPEVRTTFCINSLSDIDTPINKLLDLVIEKPHLFLEFDKLDDLIDVDKQLKWRKYTIPKIYFKYSINTYNMLYFITQFNISDVLLGEPICFDLQQVSASINNDEEKPHINIRVRPADGMPSLFTYIDNIDNGIQHFWVPPQLAYIYEPYVDIFDLTDDDEIRETALFEIYTKQEYLGDLRSLCKHMKAIIPCDYFEEKDIIKRVTCRQRCLKPGTTTCHYCRQIYDIYTLIKEKNGKIIEQEGT